MFFKSADLSDLMCNGSIIAGHLYAAATDYYQDLHCDVLSWYIPVYTPFVYGHHYFDRVARQLFQDQPFVILFFGNLSNSNNLNHQIGLTDLKEPKSKK